MQNTNDLEEFYANEAERAHVAEQLQAIWTENVKEWPGIYNFIHDEQCKDPRHDPEVCKGLLNTYGRCEMCQDAFSDEMHAAEDAAGWDPRP